MTQLVRCIVGPTAAGKTQVAAAVARTMRGVILSADSRQVYRGLDAATGKEGSPGVVSLPNLGPTPVRLIHGVPQLGLDLVDVDRRFTAAQWCAWAAPVVGRLLEAGVPVVVAGGTGLYVEALVRGFVFPPTDAALRRELEATMPSAPYRHIRRAELEHLSARPRAQTPPWHCRIVLLDPPSDVLRPRIDRRVRGWFDGTSLFEEARSLMASHAALGARTAIGYAEALALLEGRLDVDRAIARAVTRTWGYARRQRTYFRNRFPEAQRAATADDAAARLLADEPALHLRTGTEWNVTA